MEPSSHPILLAQNIGGVPIPSRMAELDQRFGFGVEVASPKSHLATAHLDKSLPVYVKSPATPPTCYQVDGGLGHRFTLVVGKNPSLGQVEPHRQRDFCHIANGIHAAELRLHRLAIYGHSLILAHKARVPSRLISTQVRAQVRV